MAEEKARTATGTRIEPITRERILKPSFSVKCSHQLRVGGCLEVQAPLDFLAVRQRHLPETQDIGAVLGAITGNSDLVPWLKRILVPAIPGQLVRTHGFGLPVFDDALIILHVEKDQGMRIDKLEICYCSLHGGFLCRVVRSRPVVCENRAHNCEEAHSRGKNGCLLDFHGTATDNANISLSSVGCQCPIV